MTTRLAHRIVLAVTAAAVLTSTAVALPASAALAPWTPPADVSAPADAHAPQFAVAADGTITAVWGQYNGTNDIVYSSRYTGAAWSAPVAISLPGADSYDASVVVRPDGSAVAVWQRQIGFLSATVQSSIYNGTSWSAPVDLTASSGYAYEMDLAVKPDGEVTAIWSLDDGSFTVFAQVSTLTGAVWSPAVSAASSPYLSETEVEVASDGSLVAVWAQGFFPDTAIFASTRSAGTWSAPVQVSLPSPGGIGTGPDYYQPELAAGPGGTMTAVWNAQVPTSTGVRTSTLAAGIWSTPVVVSAPGASGAQIAAAPNGTRAAVWLASDGSIGASIFDGTAWSAAAVLSTLSQFADDPQVTATPTGFIAVWDESTATSGVIGISEYIGGAWSAVTILSDEAFESEQPQVVIDGAGTATVIWATDEPAGSRIQFARSVAPAAAGPGAVIAATGVDAAPVALTSAALLIAGALLMQRRRRVTAD